MVVHACDSSTHYAEAGEAQCRGQPGLHSEPLDSKKNASRKRWSLLHSFFSSSTPIGAYEASTSLTELASQTIGI